MSYPRPPRSSLAWRHEPLVKRYHVLFDVQHAQGKSTSGRVRDAPAQGAPRAAFCSSRLGRTAFDADTVEVHPDVLRPGYTRADFSTVTSPPHPSRRADGPAPLLTPPVGKTGPLLSTPSRRQTGRRGSHRSAHLPVRPSGWVVRGGGPVCPSARWKGAVVSRGRVRYC